MIGADALYQRIIVQLAHIAPAASAAVKRRNACLQLAGETVAHGTVAVENRQNACGVMCGDHLLEEKPDRVHAQISGNIADAQRFTLL